MSIRYDVMPDGGYHQVIVWGTLWVADLVCAVTSHSQDKFVIFVYLITTFDIMNFDDVLMLLYDCV